MAVEIKYDDLRNLMHRNVGIEVFHEMKWIEYLSNKS